MLPGLNTVWTGMKCTTEHLPIIYVSLLSLPSNIVSSHECTKAYCNCGGSDAVNRVWQPPLPKLLRLYIIDTTPLRKSLESFRAGRAVVVFKTIAAKRAISKNSSITCEHPLWGIHHLCPLPTTAVYSFSSLSILFARSRGTRYLLGRVIRLQLLDIYFFSTSKVGIELIY